MRNHKGMILFIVVSIAVMFFIEIDKHGIYQGVIEAIMIIICCLIFLAFAAFCIYLDFK